MFYTPICLYNWVNKVDRSLKEDREAEVLNANPSLVQARSLLVLGLNGLRYPAMVANLPYTLPLGTKLFFHYFVEFPTY